MSSDNFKRQGQVLYMVCAYLSACFSTLNMLKLYEGFKKHGGIRINGDDDYNDDSDRCGTTLGHIEVSEC